MSLNLPLTAVVNNDLLFTCAPTYEGAPIILADYTLKAYLKATSTTPDDDGLQFAEGTGLTVTYASVFTWAISAASNVTTGTLWYRSDIIDSEDRVATIWYGDFTVIPA